MLKEKSFCFGKTFRLHFLLFPSEKFTAGKRKRKFTSSKKRKKRETEEGEREGGGGRENVVKHN